MIRVNKNTFIKWISVWMTTCGVVLFILFPFIDMGTLLYSITLNLLLMIWMSIVETLLIPELKSSYFDSHPIEMEGKIYKYIGVHIFRKLLVFSGWERSRKKENPIRKSLILLEYYEYRTRTSEFGHTIIAIIIFFISVYVCKAYSYKNIIWLTVFNIFFNIYPITVQRYNRPRVRRVIKNLKLKLKLKNSKIVYKNW
ncbi:hypothetical protein KPL37_15690 [Clostridium frigoris]|uniref:Glycosyl-4,4'-diaponeurosporenoate acyltransferase n=1 Tax=Clostridium frigoris TaxID=205327 RepID=A0ABS6BX32_9CLOT|nr:hypothetical protein [Clostridium frigoris]MBU3161163.1 hypothetical protein [Clostridium frigoris]